MSAFTFDTWSPTCYQKQMDQNSTDKTIILHFFPIHWSYKMVMNITELAD